MVTNGSFSANRSHSAGRSMGIGLKICTGSLLTVLVYVDANMQKTPTDFMQHPRGILSERVIHYNFGWGEKSFVRPCIGR